MASLSTTGHRFATLSNLDMQQCPKIFCNFVQKVLAKNKQIVWIQKISKIEDGEIGIFYLDGKAYIKKLQDNKKGSFLISLNKKYDPIEITPEKDFRTFGRVVG